MNDGRGWIGRAVVAGLSTGVETGRFFGIEGLASADSNVGPIRDGPKVGTDMSSLKAAWQDFTERPMTLVDQLRYRASLEKGYDGSGESRRAQHPSHVPGLKR